MQHTISCNLPVEWHHVAELAGVLGNFTSLKHLKVGWVTGDKMIVHNRAGQVTPSRGSG